MIVLIVLAAVVTAYVGSRLATPIYESTTTLLIKGAGSERLVLDMSGTQGRNDIQNYVEILRSRTIAERTAERLGLEMDVHSREFEEFRKSITVSPITNTDAVRISVQHPDPIMAAQIVNAVAASFADFNREINRQEASSAREFIEEQLALTERQLLEAENALQAFREMERAVAPTEETRLILTRLTELEVRLAEDRMAQQETHRRLEEVRRRLEREDPTFVSATTVANNPLSEIYRTRLSQLETELAGLRPQLGDNHPQVATIRAQISELQDQLTREVERIVTSETLTANPIYQELLRQMVELEVESVLYASRLSSLEEQVAQTERRLGDLPAKELNLARLTRDRNVAEQVYLLLRNRYEEVRITEAMQTSNVTVVDPGIVPEIPVRPRKLLNVAIAAVLGVMVGVGLALLQEFLDTTVRSPEEVESVLQLPVLGQIPLARHDEA